MAVPLPSGAAAPDHRADHHVVCAAALLCGRPAAPPGQLSTVSRELVSRPLGRDPDLLRRCRRRSRFIRWPGRIDSWGCGLRRRPGAVARRSRFTRRCLSGGRRRHRRRLLRRRGSHATALVTTRVMFRAACRQGEGCCTKKYRRTHYRLLAYIPSPENLHPCPLFLTVIHLSESLRGQ